MTKVAIIGSGFVGRAWAISFARAGHDTYTREIWANDYETATGAANNRCVFSSFPKVGLKVCPTGLRSTPTALSGAYRSVKANSSASPPTAG